MEKILGIDFGEIRIGLAVSDGLGLTAQGLPVLRRVSIKKDLSALKEIIRVNDVKKIVVGLPLDKDGNISHGCGVLDFIDKIKDNLQLPVDTWDERLSSFEANKVLLAADLSRNKRKKVVDKLAAQIILQGYLDYINQQSESK